MSTPKPTMDGPSLHPMPEQVTPAKPRTTTTRTGLARLIHGLQAEVKDLSLRLLLADVVVSVLPNLGFMRLRTAIYRLAGIRIGPQSLIFGRIEFTGSPPLASRLHIGSNTMINSHFFVDLNTEVRIGSGVSIGHHVMLVTAEHEQGPAACRAGDLRPQPITIEDGCWIGARVMVLPGTRIGKSSIVAAGSMVFGNIPANRLVGGVPARALRTLPSEP